MDLEKRGLKPCPFCGSEDIATFKYPFPRNGLKGDYVICMFCGASSGKYEKMKEAKRAWNKRVETQAIQDVLRMAEQG